MPRIYSAQGREMPLLRPAGPCHGRNEEAVPFVRGIRLQNDPARRCAAGAEEGSEDHGVRGVRQASVARAGEVEAVTYVLESR